MKRTTDTVLSGTTSLPVVGATIDVFLTGTATRAVLYLTNNTGGATLPNPLPTGATVAQPTLSTGTFAFYVADGVYDLVVNGPSGSVNVPDVEIYDLSEFKTNLGTFAQGTITAPAYAITQSVRWNDPPTANTFGVISLSVIRDGNVYGFFPHTLINAVVDGTNAFRVLTSGEIILNGTYSGPAIGGTFGAGIRGLGDTLYLCAGSDSGITGITRGSPVLSVNWAGGTIGQTAFISGLAANRTHLFAGVGVLTLEAAAHEREVSATTGLSEVTYRNYIGSSAIGATMSITDYGQNPTHADPLVALTSETTTGNLQLWRKKVGAAVTALARIDKFGRAFFPALSLDGNKFAAPGTIVTGTTVETTLAAFTLPGGAMGPNGQIEFDIFFSSNNGAGTKTVRVNFGGTIFYASAMGATVTGSQVHVRISNKNSNSQIGLNGGQTGYGSAIAIPITAAVDTTANVAITITAQLSNGADSCTLESYSIKTNYAA